MVICLDDFIKSDIFVSVSYIGILFGNGKFNCLSGASVNTGVTSLTVFHCMQGDDTIDERLELIIKQKAVVEKQIAELTETLRTLEFKEWYYTTAKKAGTTAVPRNMTLDELPEEYREIRVKLRGE